jgi:hypothetical protein
LSSSEVAAANPPGSSAFSLGGLDNERQCVFRKEFVMKVRIEPYCIFCGQATTNVEEQSIETYRHEYTPDTTVSHRLTIPFPAHRRCLRRRKRAGCLIIVAPPLIVFVLYTLISLILKEAYIYSSLVGCMVIPAAIGVGLYLANRANEKLENQILYYYETHVQSE